MLVSKLELRIISKVVRAREDAGLSRKEVAKALNLEEQSYGHYERGRFAFTVEQLLILSRVLRRPLTWLVGLPTELTEEEERLVHLWRTVENPVIRRLIVKQLQDAVAIEREERDRP